MTWGGDIQSRAFGAGKYAQPKANNTVTVGKGNKAATKTSAKH
jgi:hypothetical protein